MPNEKRRPDQAIVEQFFACHLPYEINMLRALYPELLSRKYSQLIHNALVEAFHLHARNIIEFFTLKSNCAFDPGWFTDGFEANTNFIDKGLTERINQQMSHLTAKRVIGTGQLGEEDWKRIKDSIDAEVSRFARALTLEYSERWSLHNTQMDIGIGAGASSQPIIVSPPKTDTTSQAPQLVIVAPKSKPA